MESGFSSAIHLEDKTVLRGVKPSTLLECFGRRLRQTAGGIGCATPADGDAEYSRSSQVDELDIFLSHSWHATWWKKYLNLLLFFNGRPAVLASTITSILIYCFNPLDLREQVYYTEQIGAPNEPTPPYFCSALDQNDVNDTMVVLSGVGAFFAVLFTWHLFQQCRDQAMRRLPGWILKGARSASYSTVFLDKVCIHQTNPERKKCGIQAIGSILSHTNKLLVAWDPTYFSRLWCLHELSAFKFAMPEGKVVVMPESLGVFVVAAAGVASTAFIFMRVSNSSGRTEDESHLLPLVAFLCLMPALKLSPHLRKFTLAREELTQQVASLSARSADCFCCTHNHVHPENGERLPCDRELVYEAIADWYGNGDQQRGIEAFNNGIRLALHRDIERTLGKWWHIPYWHSVMVGVLPSHLVFAWMDRCPVYYAFPVILEILFLRVPIFVVAMLGITRFFAAEWESRTVNLVLDVVTVIASAAVPVYITKAAVWVNDFSQPDYFMLMCWQYLVWIALQTLLVMYFYLWGPVVNQAAQTGLISIRRKTSDFISQLPAGLPMGTTSSAPTIGTTGSLRASCIQMVASQSLRAPATTPAT